MDTVEKRTKNLGTIGPEGSISSTYVSLGKVSTLKFTVMHMFYHIGVIYTTDHSIFSLLNLFTEVL